MYIVFTKFVIGAFSTLEKAVDTFLKVKAEYICYTLVDSCETTFVTETEIYEASRNLVSMYAEEYRKKYERGQKAKEYKQYENMRKFLLEKYHPISYAHKELKKADFDKMELDEIKHFLKNY